MTGWRQCPAAPGWLVRKQAFGVGLLGDGHHQLGKQILFSSSLRGKFCLLVALKPNQSNMLLWTTGVLFETTHHVLKKQSTLLVSGIPTETTHHNSIQCSTMCMVNAASCCLAQALEWQNGNGRARHVSKTLEAKGAIDWGLPEHPGPQKPPKQRFNTIHCLLVRLVICALVLVSSPGCPLASSLSALAVK